MATSPSPQMSPVMGASHRLDRNQSQTPPAQPLSKRDKRRTQLLDRLHEVSLSFSANKDFHYRQQLQAIQVDTNLILRANPYEENPLPDGSDDIYDMVIKVTGPNSQLTAALNNGGDIGSIAGKLYSEFAIEVNDAMEDRDAAMTSHQKNYERSILSLNTTNAFMIKLAEEEHRSLSTTLRDRLINSVNAKKTKLLKEKDELFNIAESNALHMHPNQYSIANPSSPGGMHGKRSTRQRRDIEDVPGFPESHKRKRKAVDDIGSPAPSKRHIENGFSTPIWTTEHVSKALTKGSGSPLYSVDKLFTEKELLMAYNTAAQAANNYILSHKTRSGSQSPPDTIGYSNIRDEDNAGNVEGDNDGHDSPPSAPLMERQYSHATRSTRNGNASSLTGVEAIADLSLPANFHIFSSTLPKLPAPFGLNMQKTWLATQNSPPENKKDETENDIQRMEICKRINEQYGNGANLFVENGDRAILAAAVAKPGEYQGWVQNSGRGKGDRRIAKGSGTSERDDGLGEQSSNEIGSVPMSRTATGEGGSSMGKRRRQ